MRQENVFYWALAPLVVFYAIFAAVLLPNIGTLHPIDKVGTWISALPESLACFVKVRIYKPAKS